MQVIYILNGSWIKWIHWSFIMIRPRRKQEKVQVKYAYDHGCMIELFQKELLLQVHMHKTLQLWYFTHRSTKNMTKVGMISLLVGCLMRRTFFSNCDSKITKLLGLVKRMNLYNVITDDQDSRVQRALWFRTFYQNWFKREC